MKAHDTKQMY